MHISRANFIFVPAVDFTQKWTDQKLYDYFDLSAEERAIIEKTMRPMDEIWFEQKTEGVQEKRCGEKKQQPRKKRWRKSWEKLI